MAGFYADMTGTTHRLAPKEIAVRAVPEDERVWVPQAPDVWFRPLMLNTLAGQWCNLLRVRKAGVLSAATSIPAPVHGYVIKGRWHYLEHDWVAETGSYVFEPPGEIHTLVGRRGLRGDDHLLQHLRLHELSSTSSGEHIGFEDVFTKIDMCRAHYDERRARGGLCRPVHPLTRSPGPSRRTSSPARGSWSRAARRASAPR